MFPWNVDTSNKGGGSGGIGSSTERLQFGIGLFVLVNVIIAFNLASVMITLGIPLWLGYLAQFIIVGCIGVFVLRFVILNENEQIREYESGESFIKYYKFRKGAHEEYEINNKKIFAYEYDNGTCAFVMQLKYGANDERRMRATEEALKRLYSTIASNRLELRLLILPEDFLAGNEAKWLMDSTSKSRGTKRGKFNLKLVNTALEVSKESNLECLYIMVRTTAIYQKYELDSILRTCMNIFSSGYTCFREINFLEEDGINRLLRDFYGVEVIDLSAVKAVESTMETISAYQELVQIYRISSAEGKSFTRGKDGSRKTNVKEI